LAWLENIPIRAELALWLGGPHQDVLPVNPTHFRKFTTRLTAQINWEPLHYLHKKSFIYHSLENNLEFP
jgi:hypothetical protein